MAGFANDVVYANNGDFSIAASAKGSIANGLLTNGQMWIGSTALNAGGTHISVGTLQSPGGTITIGYSSPNITIDIAGGAVAIEKINLQTGTTPIAPISGAITFNGATVASGTNPVRTNGTGPNTMALQVQTAQAIASTNATNIGLSAFNSSQFTVDANGFVSITNFSPFIYTAVTHATGAPYVVVATDYYISCDPTAGVITINLPNSPTTFREFVIKDRTGQASTNNISITTVGGSVTIDGQTTYTLAGNYGAIQLLFNGTSYEVF
jgi:hypothetical protein